MPYLYQTCDGPSLVRCGATIEETSESPDEFFLEVDKCLKYSSCLTYHQILLYNEKQMGLDISNIPDPSEDRAPKNVHDLQLAELNFLCIEESISEPNLAAKQHMFSHCVDHLFTLYQQGKYA